MIHAVTYIGTLLDPGLLRERGCKRSCCSINECRLWGPGQMWQWGASIHAVTSTVAIASARVLVLATVAIREWELDVGSLMANVEFGSWELYCGINSLASDSRNWFPEEDLRVLVIAIQVFGRVQTHIQPWDFVICKLVYRIWIGR